MRHGCPVCSINKAEAAAKTFLEAHPLVESYDPQHKLKVWDDNAGKARNLRLDGFVILHNGEQFGLELDGQTHFKPETYYSSPTKIKDQLSRDLAKEAHFRDHEMHLIRIPYTDYDRIPLHLEEFVQRVSATPSHEVVQHYVNQSMYEQRDEMAERLGLV